MRRSLVAAAFMAVVFAACGSVTDSVNFHVPPQYTSAASLGPFMQVWESADRSSAIMLMAVPGQMNIDKTFDDKTLNMAQIKGATVKKKERITICGNQQAMFATLEGTTNTGTSTSRPSDIEFLATPAKGQTYVAMYARPLHASPDAAAEAALRSVCAK